MMLFEVIDIKTDCLICEVLTDGLLDDCQTVAVEGIKLHLPFLTGKDETDIIFADKMNVDFIALSYVSSAEEVLAVNDMLIGLKNDHIGIISKIESEDGINNLDEIIRVSDGIMVARGDLGVDIPLERVPGVQKKIIQKCHAAGIVSIVATELLSSMETASRPTRAEVSDVANAVLDGADAVMLSGETTIGKFPIETLNMMEKIINSAEKDINYLEFIKEFDDNDSDITGMVANNVVISASKLKCCAIIAPTISGYTARKMSRYRPSCPIIAVSPKIDTVKSLQLHFAVTPVLIDELKSLEKIIEVSKKITFKLISTKPGDRIIITGGYPFNEVKSTNFMKIEEL
jgi:pyruvate kinase